MPARKGFLLLRALSDAPERSERGETNAVIFLLLSLTSRFIEVSVVLAP